MSLLLALLLSPGAAEACSMFVVPPDLGLPGASAGPDAVFSTSVVGATVFGPDDIEIAVSRLPFLADGREGEVLVPVERLGEGVYRLDPCDDASCDTTIVADGGDPGVAPEPPVLAFEGTHVSSGRRADCGPQVGATIVTATSDAIAVVLAEAPVDSLDGAELISVLSPDGEGAFTDTTRHDGEVFAAAVDAEGELSEWSGPHTLSPGCSSAGGPVGLALVLAGVFAGLKRRPAAQPSGPPPHRIGLRPTA